MAKFKIIFHRHVTEMDEVERVIEAPSEQLANEQAALMACEFDHNCPDDAAPVGGADCDNWFVEFVLQAPDDTPLSDDEPVEWPVPTGAEVTSNGLNEALAPGGE